MQKYITISFFILFIANTSFAQNHITNEKVSNSTLSIQPKIGYSISKSSFNIAGNELGKNPTVLSELIWDPTNAIEYGLNLNFTHKRFVVNSEILLNQTLSGNVTDFDYDGDYRTDPTSKLYLSNHKGFGHSFLLQPGYNWSNAERISLITYLSFEHISKSLYLLNDKDWRANDQNYISGLNSYYKYKFPNYGIGVKMSYQFNKNWNTHLNIVGHFSKYYAYGNWNLIESFEKPISYEHKGNGKKIGANFGVDYTISPRISIGSEYSFNNFNVTNGKDYLYHKEDGLLKTRLNEAKESKHSFLINLRYNLYLN